MYHLAYVSTARSLFHKEDVISLLVRSRDKNRQRGITGFLLYQNGEIFQVLEGEQEAVQGLYLRIKQDSRHKNVVMVLAEELAEREFPNWQMAFQDSESDVVRNIEGFSEYMNSPWSHEEGAPGKGKTRKLISIFKYVHLQNSLSGVT